MLLGDDALRRRLWTATFWIVAVASAWQFTHVRLLLNGEFTSQAPIARLMAYTADLPFQYRVLAPMILNGLPDALFSGSRGKLFSLEFAASLGTIFAFRWWIGPYLRSGALASLLSLAILPCLLFNYVLPRDTPVFMPSDIPSVFFFTMGLALLREKRWLWYYPLFALATLNRETACFLTIIYALVYWDEFRERSYWIHLVSQTALWFAIKIPLYVIFRENGGEFLYHHIGHNFEVLMIPQAWPILMSSLGFTGVISLLGFPLIRDRFIRRALLCLIPFGVGMFLVGRIIEMRIFGELAPLTLCATLLIGSELANWVDRDPGDAGEGGGAVAGDGSRGATQDDADRGLTTG